MATATDAGPLVIGLDLGTGSCKAVALSAGGRIEGQSSAAYPLRIDTPEWAEQDPEDVWRGSLEALGALAAQVDTRRVAGICLSGALHSLFPVSRAGEPLALSMTWVDNRAMPQAAELRAAHSPQQARELILRVGSPLLQPVYHPARLRWWKAHSAGLAEPPARYVGIKDFVLFRMTGQWATDWGLGSSTAMLDIHRLDWDAQALDIAGVTPDELCPLVSPLSVVGGLCPEAARLAGLPAGLPVVAGAPDGGLANVGAGAVRPGQAVVTVGTSGAVRKMLDRPWIDAEGRTWCYVLTDSIWYAGGAISHGGLALQWLCEKLYPGLPHDQALQAVFAEVASVPPGAEGLFCLPYFTGDRSPHWDANVRAAFLGLGLRHGRAHMARAVLEGVAYCLADIWEALGRASRPGEPLFLTGGITHNPLWAAMLADVLGEPLAPVEAADASVMGAAMLGHWALGHVDGLEQIARFSQPGALIQPDEQRHALYVRLHQQFQALYGSVSRLV